MEIKIRFAIILKGGQTSFNFIINLLFYKFFLDIIFDYDNIFSGGIKLNKEEAFLKLMQEIAVLPATAKWEDFFERVFTILEKLDSKEEAIEIVANLTNACQFPLRVRAVNFLKELALKSVRPIEKPEEPEISEIRGETTGG